MALISNRKDDSDRLRDKIAKVLGKVGSWIGQNTKAILMLLLVYAFARLQRIILENNEISERTKNIKADTNLKIAEATKIKLEAYSKKNRILSTNTSDSV